MRIGFVDCATNLIDVYEGLAELAEQKMANVTFSRSTAPDLTKIPVCSKRLFTEGVDGVLVFATATGEEADVLKLVHEKVMDVEIEASKFVFMVVIFDDEARTPAALQDVAAKRLSDSLDHLLSLSKPSSTMQSSEDAMGMFSAPPAPDADLEPASQGAEAGSQPDSSSTRSLF